eukprot:Skav232037  [mRNA]  locus=scaffold2323:207450:208076:+ [translate_table: standard]
MLLQQDEAYARAKGPRHLLMDARGWEVCNYMWEQTMPLRLAHRINVELNGLLEDGPESWTLGKPFVWYQFPYPAVYHGPAALVPAKLRAGQRPVPSNRYLWGFTGTGRGSAGDLRQRLKDQCNKCHRWVDVGGWVDGWMA